MNMPTEPLEAAVSLFIADVTSEDGLGFPDNAAIVPDKRSAETAAIVWECLSEGRPIVLVGAAEPVMLIEPVRSRVWGKFRTGLLRRMTVQLSYRCKDGTRPDLEFTPPVRVDIGRRALERAPAVV